MAVRHAFPLLAAMSAALFPACDAPAGKPRPGVMQWPDLLGRPVPQPTREIRYGSDPLQVIDLWLPKGSGPWPVVLMIHGGCWQSDVADRTIMNWIADDLAKRGIAVWNIDYRGVDRPGGGYPGTFEDVAKAADLLTRDGAKYHLKTDKLVAIGHSAGGHLALWLSARTKLPLSSRFHGDAPFTPAAVISQGGIPDLRALGAQGNSGCSTGARAMAGQSAPERSDVYADTSPPEMTPGPARLFQVNGELDSIAPPAYAARFMRAMKARGATVDSFVIPASGHVELIAPDTLAWAKQVELLESLLGR